MQVTTMTSRTKRGDEILVAVIPQAMAPGLECQHAASDIAARHGCTHYRVVAADGRLVAVGKAHSSATYSTGAPDDRDD